MRRLLSLAEMLALPPDDDDWFEEGTNKDVPSARAEREKDDTVQVNPSGQPETIMRRKNNRKLRVLSELPEEPPVQEHAGDIGEPLWLQESAMTIRRRRSINEAVQDKAGVKGDFMTHMGGRTERLGGKQKNTGHAYEDAGESTHGEPTDGITTHHADLNLRTKQRNTGAGIEDFGDSKHGTASDGITSHRADLNLTTRQKNTGGQWETFTGSKNTMNGVAEEWSIGNIASIMEGSSVNLMELFDRYAAQSHTVCLDEFQQIVMAHGMQTVLSEQHLVDLMRLSRKFMFYEGQDYQGRFWQPRPITESAGLEDEQRPDPTEGEEEDPRHAHSDAILSKGAKLGGDNIEIAEDDEIDGELPIDGEMPMGDMGDMGGMGGEMEIPASGTMAEPDDMEGDIENIGAGLEDGEDELADIFQQIGDDFARAADLMAGHDESMETPEDEAVEGDLEFGDEEGLGEEGLGEEGFGDEEGEEIEGDEEVEESADLGMEMPGGEEAVSPDSSEMMSSISNNAKGKATATKSGRKDTAETADDKEQEDDQALSGEDDEIKTESRGRCRRCGYALDVYGCASCALHEDLELDAKPQASEKTGLYTPHKGKEKGELGTKVPSQGTVPAKGGNVGEANKGITKELRGSDLKRKQKNTGGTFEVKENIARLAVAAKNAIEEGAHKIGRAGKYQLRFVVSTEGLRPIPHKILAEALADVEELVQARGSKRVRFEARFYLPSNRKPILCHRLPIATIKRRGPIVAEGKVLFRIPEVADAFADRIVSEGVTCRVANHNWGVAVSGGFNYGMAKHAFGILSEAWGTQVRPPEEEMAGATDEYGPDDTAMTDEFRGGSNMAHQTTLPDSGIDTSEVDDEIGGGYPGEEEEGFDAGFGGEAPGPFDTEGACCPNCGCCDVGDQSGACPECGEQRPGGSPEADFGAHEDPRFGESDEYLDWSNGSGIDLQDEMIDDEADPAEMNRSRPDPRGMAGPEERAPMPQSQRRPQQQPAGRPARV